MAFQASDLVGSWRVKFRQWTWEYTLAADGRATWRDPLNGETGSGRWGQAPKVIFFVWNGSTTKESWNLPVSDRMFGWIDASYGVGAAQVEKLGGGSAPSRPAPEGQLDATACWAATYAWWLRATPGQTAKAQVEILSEGSVFGDLVTPPKGTVNIERYMFFLTRRHEGMGSSRFTPGEFKEFLKASRLPNVPIIVGFASSVMGGHANVIHAFDAANEKVTVMEPWFPDPTVDPNYSLQNFDGFPVFVNRQTGAPYMFRGTHTTRHLQFYLSRPLIGRLLVFPDNR